ncbi:MAG: hypothetical protein ABL930_12930, partial [Pseudobdellovibrio sp.]
MSFLIIIFLIFVSLFYLAFKKNKKSFFVLSLCAIYSVGAGSGYFSEILLKDLQVHEALRNPQWQPSNVIVLLGSGST